MEINGIEILNILAIIAILIIPFLKTRANGFFSVGIISLQVIVTTITSISIFSKGNIEVIYPGSWTTGLIPIRIDYLSAWFMIVISFTFLTGAWFGLQYMKKYEEQTANLRMHSIAYILAYTSLIDICVVQNSLVLLVFWEIMALSSFLLIIFEHQKQETLRAGINFLIQSHICILFLTIAFIWINSKTGSFDFKSITTYTASEPSIIGVSLFIFFLCGFAIKAGFVPFHTWLPLAHPAAPAHVSGVMSGVIIKIGIYGILRVLLLIRTDMIFIGYFMLAISLITGIYGVMLAILQHNLKKLLAYHSIENIGIIGIGIGIGCLGLGYHNQLLVMSGFGGALLHTLNHSLFKSLLFYSAGNVYLTRHSMNIESLGGLIKHIPHTAYLFLLGSLAICGLPPFNGFISEFFIYTGLFNGLLVNNFIFSLVMLFTIIGLVLIGGLALICFTKAFGIVFLGNERQKLHHERAVEKPLNLIPLYFTGALILLIGLFPVFFSSFLVKILIQFSPSFTIENSLQFSKGIYKLSTIGWYSFGFIGLISIVYLIRYLLTRNRINAADNTWGCGYTGETKKMQYTASSFIRAYRKLAEPLFMIKKEKHDAIGLYPTKIQGITHPGDKVEYWLIDKPLFQIRKLLHYFVFLQNGYIQSYILYGFLFICLAIAMPVAIELIVLFVKFFNQL